MAESHPHSSEELSNMVMPSCCKLIKNICLEEYSFEVIIDQWALLRHDDENLDFSLLGQCFVNCYRSDLIKLALKKEYPQKEDVLFGIKKHMNDSRPLLINGLLEKDIDLLDMLLTKLGADINIQDAFGNTPLHISVIMPDSEELIRFLLEKGADTTIKNKKGETPFLLAVCCGKIETIHLLLTKEDKIDVLTEYGRKIMDCAFRRKNRNLIAFLTACYVVNLVPAPGENVAEPSQDWIWS